MTDRRADPRIQQLFRQPGDAIGILGVDHRHRAFTSGESQQLEDLSVVELQVVVGHVELERRVAFGDQRRQLLAKHVRRRVADDQVKRIIDQCFAGRRGDGNRRPPRATSVHESDRQRG
jgi:hypothetical protein